MFNLTKIVFLTISNILIQLRDKLAKIKVNYYCLININKVNITIYIIYLIKKNCLKFLKQIQFLAICIVYKIE